MMNAALRRYLLPSFVRRRLLYVLTAFLALGTLPFASLARHAMADPCIQNGVLVDPCPDSSPPDLLNGNLLNAGRLGPLGLYAATASQIASLQNLENQAIANTITEHSLAASDSAAVQSWGRNVGDPHHVDARRGPWRSS
jgi:hypothetical protein